MNVRPEPPALPLGSYANSKLVIAYGGRRSLFKCLYVTCGEITESHLNKLIPFNVLALMAAKPKQRAQDLFGRSQRLMYVIDRATLTSSSRFESVGMAGLAKRTGSQGTVEE